MKALPLAYNKDMQEDKEAVFDTVDNIGICLQAMAGMLRDFSVDKERMQKSAGVAYATATDLADFLVRELKIPFRDAHHITAKIVKLASDKGKDLEQLSLKDMQTIEKKISQKVFSVLSVENSVKTRTSYGGTAPDNVKKAVTEAKKGMK